MKRILFAAIALALTSTAAAQGLYATGAIGRSQASIAGGPNVSSTAWRVGAGQTVHRAIALEAGWMDIGSANATAGKVSADGPYLQGLLLVEPVRGLQAFVKAGVAYQRTSTPLGSDSSLTPVYGGGILYHVTKTMAARLEYERLHKLGNPQIGEARASVLSAGLQISF